MLNLISVSEFGKNKYSTFYCREINFLKILNNLTYTAVLSHGIAVPVFTQRKMFLTVYLVNLQFCKWYHSHI